MKPLKELIVTTRVIIETVSACFSLRCLRSVILSAFVAIPAMLVFSEVSNAQEFSTVGFEKIVIVAPAAQVNLVSGTNALIRITPQLQTSWSAREEGKTLRLIATSNPGVAKSAASGLQKVDVMIPPVPVDLHLVHGDVMIGKWTRNLLVDVQKGRVQAKDVRAALAVQVGQGNVTVQDHLGSLRIDSYQGDVQVTGLQGSLEFSGRQSEVKIAKASGNLRVQLYNGGIEVKDSAGSLQFQTTKAGLAAPLFKGRIDGASEEGVVSLQLTSETEVNVQAGSGRVSLEGKSSGSLLVLRAEEGEIVSPKNLRAGRDRGAQVLRARMKGTAGARVDVVSRKGTIVVKE